MNKSAMIMFIVGPTASGKSRLAMELARALDGEIVCADSQTLRRSLDIGTAKPSLRDRREIKHHMLDLVEPYDRFSVNQFKILAKSAIADIQTRGRLPIVAGGTGLYVDALYFDYNISSDSENSDYKRELEKMSVVQLQEIIKNKGYPMPINENNPRHLIGTILRDGVTHKDVQPLPGAAIYGLNPNDVELRRRITERVDTMFEEGLVAEVKKIIIKYGEPPDKLDAIGYPILARLLRSEIDEAEARRLFVQAHWQYARRQKSWFNRNKNIRWFKEVKEAFEHICSEIV